MAEVQALTRLEETRSRQGHRMYLYSERDVELASWRKYGGPEGFRAHLIRCLDEYIKKHGNTDGFEEPDTCPVKPPPPDHSWDVVVSLHHQIDAKASGCDWLWKRCTEISMEWYDWLWEPPVDVDQIAFLESAVKHLPQYPPRTAPSDIAMSTASFLALKEVLSEAPGLEERCFGYDTPNLRYSYDGFTGEEDLEWNDHYFSRVYERLIDVVREHGSEGWKDARWMIYDTYSQSMSGITIYNDKGWVAQDNAAFWLFNPRATSRPFNGHANPPLSYLEYVSLWS